MTARAHSREHIRAEIFSKYTEFRAVKFQKYSSSFSPTECMRATVSEGGRTLTLIHFPQGVTLGTYLASGYCLGLGSLNLSAGAGAAAFKRSNISLARRRQKIRY